MNKNSKLAGQGFPHCNCVIDQCNLKNSCKYQTFFEIATVTVPLLKQKRSIFSLTYFELCVLRLLAMLIIFIVR